MTRPLLITGAIGSPYTRKMKALLLYRRIPYQFIEFNAAKHRNLPKTPLPLLPGIYIPEGDDGYRATSDSSFQLRELEELYSGRSALPTDPALDFLAYLIEDFADEWLTKVMFYYRWGIAENVDHASKMLPLWQLGVPDQFLEVFKNTFAQRQIDRLSGVVAGSIEVSGPILEAGYQRLLVLLREHFKDQKFVLGERPSAGDFGLYGQLTQLVQVEPTSMALARAEAPRVMAWVDIVDDLSGLDVKDGEGWVDRNALPDTFCELLGEIGRTYAPFMLGNHNALERGNEQMECRIDGQRYWQKSFPYQRKCLDWLRQEYAKLADRDRSFIDKTLSGTGCEALIQAA